MSFVFVFKGRDLFGQQQNKDLWAVKFNRFLRRPTTLKSNKKLSIETEHFAHAPKIVARQR